VVVRLHEDRPDYFACSYLKRSLPLKMAGFHEIIYGDVADSSLTRLAYIAPTGFGKSSVIGFAVPIWASCYKKANEILYVSASGRFAEEKLRRIRMEIESNEDLQRDFDLSPGPVWRDDEIILSNGVRTIARGMGSQITGMRPNLIILDDIEDDETVRSEVKRAHLWEWLNIVIFNRVGPGDRILVIGSLISRLSFLHKLIGKEAEARGWRSRVFTATEGGLSTWDERFSTNDLEDRRRELAGLPGVYEALYSADVGGYEKYAFKKDWLAYYTNAPDRLRVFTVVDPGAGEKEGDSYTAIVTVGVHPDTGYIYVLDVIKRRYNVQTLELFGAMFMVYDTFRPIKFGIESVVFQKYLGPFFLKECRERGKTPNVVELKRDNRVSKDQRIRSLSHWFEEGKILIRPDMYALIAEYEAYPDCATVDVLDALSMAVNDMVSKGGTSSNRGSPPMYKASNRIINF